MLVGLALADRPQDPPLLPLELLLLKVLLDLGPPELVPEGLYFLLIVPLDQGLLSLNFFNLAFQLVDHNSVLLQGSLPHYKVLLHSLRPRLPAPPQILLFLLIVAEIVEVVLEDSPPLLDYTLVLLYVLLQTLHPLVALLGLALLAAQMLLVGLPFLLQVQIFFLDFILEAFDLGIQGLLRFNKVLEVLYLALQLPLLPPDCLKAQAVLPLYFAGPGPVLPHQLLLLKLKLGLLLLQLHPYAFQLLLFGFIPEVPLVVFLVELQAHLPVLLLNPFQYIH